MYQQRRALKPAARGAGRTRLLGTPRRRREWREHRDTRGCKTAVVNVSRIDLNLFVVLNAIYTEGGITKASERLHLTQPAVSHALARLCASFCRTLCSSAKGMRWSRLRSRTASSDRPFAPSTRSRRAQPHQSVRPAAVDSPVSRGHAPCRRIGDAATARQQGAQRRTGGSARRRAARPGDTHHGAGAGQARCRHRRHAAACAEPFLRPLVRRRHGRGCQKGAPAGGGITRPGELP